MECMKRFQVTSSSCPDPGALYQASTLRATAGVSYFFYFFYEAGHYSKITPKRVIIAGTLYLKVQEEIYFANF